MEGLKLSSTAYSNLDILQVRVQLLKRMYNGGEFLVILHIKRAQ